MRNKIKAAGIVIFWIAIWQIAAMIINNNIFFAGPVAVIRRLLDFVIDGAYWINIAYSVFRIIGGFLFAFLCAYILANLAYERSFIAELIYPVVMALRSVPVAAVVVIISIMAGSRWLSLYVTFMVVFPIVYMNILEGLKGLDKGMLEMADIYLISWPDRYRYIYVPAIKSEILSAVKTGVGMSFKSGVAAEVISLCENSIGSGIYSSKIYLDTPGVLAWTVTVVGISYIFEKVIVAFFSILFEIRRVNNESQTFNEKSDNDYFTNNIVFSHKPAMENLEIKNYSKLYGENIVISNFSFIFESGKNYCISSASGRGKTTLIKLIAGMDAEANKEKHRFSFSFQETRLCDTATVYENLRMVNKDISLDFTKRLMANAGMNDAALKRAGELSGGMKKRVEVLRALVYSSDIVILDEPFTGLDRENVIRLIELIKALKNNRTIIFTSHDGMYTDELNAEIIGGFYNEAGINRNNC